MVSLAVGVLWTATDCLWLCLFVLYHSPVLRSKAMLIVNGKFILNMECQCLAQSWFLGWEMDFGIPATLEKSNHDDAMKYLHLKWRVAAVGG